MNGMGDIRRNKTGSGRIPPLQMSMQQLTFSPSRLAASWALIGALLLLVAGCGPSEEPTGEQAGVEGEAQWSEDYPAALARAQESDRPMFVLFTGSDWCPPCMQLEKNVFSSPVFAEFAEENLTLMKADFPRGKQDEAIAKQNAGLQRQYPIQGFPTVLLLNPQDGKVIFARSGYGGVTAEEYVEEIRAALPQG